ncbi:MAG: esterase/lipase family protein [Actinomycetota bacterium]
MSAEKNERILQPASWSESIEPPWAPGTPRPNRRARRENAPPWPLFATEFSRAALGYGLLRATAPFLRAVPEGDGHPVLVLPGLLAGDRSTMPLRHYLIGLGYHVHGWRLGRNVGPTPATVKGLQDRLSALSDRHQKRITLIGWSLGGIFARELARRSADSVRMVVTMGTPFRLTHYGQTRATRTYERLSRLHIDPSSLPPPEHARPPMPTTSIYSKLDGIVSWKACIDDVGPTSENVAVYSSHLGLGHNPTVLWVVADRLAQPEGAWRAFRPPIFARPLFPRQD